MKRTAKQCIEVAFNDATPAIQKAAGHKVLFFVQQLVSVFSFSDFKAKAFRFCLFFYPRVILSGVRSTTQRVILSEVRGTESKDLAI